MRWASLFSFDVFVGDNAYTLQWRHNERNCIGLTIVYSGADQRKHLSSASLAFVRGINRGQVNPGIHRGPVNTQHKGPVTRDMLPLDDVIM